MRDKCLPLYLPPDVYQALAERARAAEREPVQQARWMLKQALGTPASGAAPRGDQEADHAAC